MRKQQESGVPSFLISLHHLHGSDGRGRKKNMGYGKYTYRIRGATFDEGLFADETICVSHDTKVMNLLLATIEDIGALSGMKLNNGKMKHFYLEVRLR